MGLPLELTALNAAFPDYVDADHCTVVFNVRPGDVRGVEPDPFFHWHGAYFELDLETGEPLDDLVASILEAVIDRELHGLAKDFVKMLSPTDRAFYSSGKARRWGRGLLGPDGSKATYFQNVLVRRSDGPTWEHWEIGVDASQTSQQLDVAALARLTYPVFDLQLAAEAADEPVACEPAWAADCSEAAWLDGSSLIRRNSGTGHAITAVPGCFTPIRFVPLELRSRFLDVAAATPAVAMTGATLGRGGDFASSASTEIAVALGAALGQQADTHQIRTMASASMQGHRGLMSADADLTAGFIQHAGCRAVHFKGTNAVRLHGDCWRVPHGTSYVLQELDDDFSNHAKEACLMACAANPRSVALCCNGGPTVATNAVRFLHLTAPGHVFSVSGFHGAAGGSGAIGSIPLSQEQLVEAIESLIDLCPDFFASRADASKEAVNTMLQVRPLTILDIADGGCRSKCFAMQAGTPNLERSAGFTAEAAASEIEQYCRSCAEVISEAIA